MNISRLLIIMIIFILNILLILNYNLTYKIDIKKY